MHIDGTLLDEHVIAPHLVEQLGAAVHALGVGHQEMQQAEFGRPQIDGMLAGDNAMGHRIEAQCAGQGFVTGDLNGILGDLRCAPPQHGLDARQQFARRKWFGDVVIGADFQAEDLVVLLAARGEHDDGHHARPLFRAQTACQLDAAHARQHPVEQDQVGQLMVDLAQRALGIERRQGDVTSAHQVGGNQGLDRGLVFDYQDVGGHIWIQ